LCVVSGNLQVLRKQALASLGPVAGLLQRIGERFDSAGYQISLVGGPVRDALVGRLTARAAEVARAFPGASAKVVMDHVLDHVDREGLVARSPRTAPRRTTRIHVSPKWSSAPSCPRI